MQNVEYNKETGLPSDIPLDIKLPAGFPEKYRESLIHVAGLCLVKKSIVNPPQFKIISSII
jgi:putative redox protein